ncbi:hypothetical protein DL766_009239 [Monosporascus sp. MC13-8B]|uniref:EXPERA domain-containing protein n=1 Tax=Monosporascus cannonballus TaxID=155416 RepID=A0ABY0HDZ4_9PEZI|nr:hypothetical protein DL762_003715 [Monosporascus cannonballus]RYP00569.1 hypothetical protein DL763_000766 [Monosporascus cannonballus]RYP16029.1 hypothetical protein DL766_009239 [Monosporascus sp. MC13-8B]
MVTTRSASRAATPAPPAPPAKNGNNNSNSRSRGSRRQGASWAHAPSRMTLLWFAVSLPLVVWDSLYVLLRPLTMEGGALHWPLWVPYRLYGEIDHVYGWKAFRSRSGFTAAQGSLNVVETALYLAYLWIYFARRQARGEGAGGGSGNRTTTTTTKVLSGRPAAVAVLLAFSGAVMTLSKTVLYWLNEYFSGFDNIGHNSPRDLIFLWIIPNGGWLIFPAYMIYVMGGEIVEGLTAAAAEASIKSE